MPKSDCGYLVRERFHSEGFKPNIQFEVEDNETILSMVQEGLGITIVPRLTLPRRIINVKIVELVPVINRQIGLVIKSLKECTPAVKEFIKLSQNFVLK